MTDQIQNAFSEKERNSEVMSSFGHRLYNQFLQNKAYRRAKELIWLEDLRSYKGIYDPSVKIDTNNSKVYPKIPRSKVNIVLSRLHEMLFPEKEKNWGLEPTPEPKIAKETVTKIAKSLIIPPEIDPQTGQTVIDQLTGQPSEMRIPTAEELKAEINDYCKKASEKMSIQIDDQLTEMDYPEETKKVLRSGLQYGTGIIKGPLVGKRTKRLWQPTEDGLDYEENIETEDIPDMRFTRIWDWYPDMSTTDIDKIEGSFERHIMTKHDLRRLMKRPDFYKDVISDFLNNNKDGDYVPENWEADLQVIEIEAGSTEVGSAVNSTGDYKDKSTSTQMGKKYEVLEYWGYVDGSDLEACGIDVDDVSLEYTANIWLLGKKPIKALLFPKALSQYKIFYYEKDETSIFGEGLIRVMRHSTLSIASAARMVLDNSSCVAGPQVEINWSLMTPGTDLNSFYPRKIWYREGKGIDAQYPAMRVYNIDSHIDELIRVIELFKSFGDEETTLPTWMIGQQVNNETAQATSGRNATVLVSIKDIVKNFDTFTESVIRDIYAWNMEFNPRQDIKGDFKCKARGVSSLVMKEVRMQALSQLTATMTPEEWAYIPKREFLTEKFKSYDIMIELLTEEEVQKNQEAQKQSEQYQLAIKMQEAEIEYKKAQTISQLTKAKDKNIEAAKKAQTPIESTPQTNPELQRMQVVGAETDNLSKQEEMRMAEERHQQELRHKDEKMAMETIKTAHDIAGKKNSFKKNKNKGGMNVTKQR